MSVSGVIVWIMTITILSANEIEVPLSVWIVSGLLLGGAIFNKLAEPLEITKGEENDDKER